MSEGIELLWLKIHDEVVERPRDAFVCYDIGRQGVGGGLELKMVVGGYDCE